MQRKDQAPTLRFTRNANARREHEQAACLLAKLAPVQSYSRAWAHPGGAVALVLVSLWNLTPS